MTKKTKTEKTSKKKDLVEEKIPTPEKTVEKKSKEKKSNPLRQPAEGKATSMGDLLKETTTVAPKKGDQINAAIISIERRQMMFDIGWKSYAVLGDRETKELTSYLPYFKPGDIVPVKVVVEESKDGYPVVSMRKFFEKGKWDILTDKQKNEEEIEVVCGEFGRGGIFVDFMGIRGVIPKIQLAEEFMNEPEKLYGHKIKVKLLEVDKSKNRLVVSQKASVLGISYKDIKREFDAVKVGGTYKSRVIGFSDFGVFCEIGGIEGLIHISEISWAKVVNPSHHLHIGDVIDVCVVEKNEENFKLNLSIKRLTQDPWAEIEKKYVADKQIAGEIIRKERYGYIVRLEEGVEGLIHVSKIEGFDDLEIGKKINVYIEKIDAKSRRISLILVPKEKPVAYR